MSFELPCKRSDSTPCCKGLEHDSIPHYLIFLIELIDAGGWRLALGRWWWQVAAKNAVAAPAGFRSECGLERKTLFFGRERVPVVNLPPTPSAR